MPRQRGCSVIDGVFIHPASCIYYSCRCMSPLDCTIQGCENKGGSYCVRKICVQGLFYIIGKTKYFSFDSRLRNFSFSSHPQPTSVYANAAFFEQNPTILMDSSQDSNFLKESGRVTPTQVRWEIQLEYWTIHAGSEHSCDRAGGFKMIWG
jgi:hypothetical protein